MVWRAVLDQNLTLGTLATGRATGGMEGPAACGWLSRGKGDVSVVLLGATAYKGAAVVAK